MINMMQGRSHHQRNIENTGDSINHNSEPLTRQRIHVPKYNDGFAAGHDVTVSSTMIKVTYNKGIKNHSVTSAYGNEFGEKTHSLNYKTSVVNINDNILTGIKNRQKNFNDIVLLEVEKNNRTNLKKEFKDAFTEEYLPVINEEKKNCGTLNRKLFSKAVNSARYNKLNNHCQYLKQKQVNKLNLVVSKMDFKESEKASNSPLSENHINEENQNHKNSNSNEIKKIIKNDNFKKLNGNKNFSFSDNTMNVQIKKDRTKLDISNNIEKERLKYPKNKNDNFKKKRTPSEEVFNQNKKMKIESDISTGKQIREKINVLKVKVKEKKLNVNHKEKKTPARIVSGAQDIMGSHKKELLHDDPTLPAGWHRIIKGKHRGTEFKPVVCIVSPEGRKFYFKAKLKEYLQKTNSPLTTDYFHFGLYKKIMEVNSGGEINARKGRKKKKQEGNSSQQKKSKKINSIENKNSSNTGHDDSFALLNISSEGIQKGNSNFNSGETSKKTEETGDSEKKNLLMIDPDLPPGWIRKIRIKDNTEKPDKFQVWVISPDGKKFRRKYLLHKYLIKTRSPLDINQFYFGLYPRKESSKTDSPIGPNKGTLMKYKNHGKIKNSAGLAKKPKKMIKYDTEKKEQFSDVPNNNNSNDNSYSGILGDRQMTLILTRVEDGDDQPMIEDPNLPHGWHRYIKVRSAGESAGRMEVIIVSPDGRKHRSKRGLEHYISQKGLDLKVDDFDFSVFGRNSKSCSSNVINTSFPKNAVKKRDSLLLSSCTAFPNLNFNHPSFSEATNRSREALMINYVSGLMLNCGLRDLRSERRLRIPKEEHEKGLKKYLDSEEVEADISSENEIPSTWVQKLIHCRSDLGTLDVEAASTIASLATDFLRNLTRRAMDISKSDMTLEYGDLAELVDRSECLSPLKSLIPKKITYREYIRLNRPKKFSSFT